MGTPRVDAAQLLVADLVAGDVSATLDPAQLLGMAPAVLVGPPRVTFDVGVGCTASWRLLLVASSGDELSAWLQLDELLAAVEDQLPVESAEPSRFSPGNGEPPLPAYAVTYTDTIPS